MKHAVIRVLMAFVILVALGAQSTIIAADKLPIQQGVYLPEGVECPKPSMIKSGLVYNIPKESILYRSEGAFFLHEDDLSYAINNVRNKGNVYYIKGNVMAQAGMNPIVASFAMTIIINSKTSFSIIKTEDIGPFKSGAVFRYCKNQNM